MRSNRRAGRRALLFMLMLGALTAPRANAQYFEHTPLEAWRKAAGIAAPLAVKRKVGATALSKDDLDTMSQTSAVRVGCGISQDMILTNLTLSFSELVGIAWGGMLFLIGLHSAFGRSKGGLRTAIRGAGIVGAAFASPFVCNSMLQLLQNSAHAPGFIATLVGGLTCSAALLGIIVASSPDRLATLKRMGKLYMGIAAVLGVLYCTFAGFNWYQEMSNARIHSATTTPNHSTPNSGGVSSTPLFW